jgi:hypothetical protein
MIDRIENEKIAKIEKYLISEEPKDLFLALYSLEESKQFMVT